MLQLTIAGNLGRDAEYKETQSGKSLCSFAVAASVGYGDNKQTYWVDVSNWGQGAKGLAGILVKGSKVAVTGELTTREHNGKTYLQCRADKVTILGTPQGGSQREPDGSRGAPPQQQGGGFADDLDDDIPFVRMGGHEL